MDGDSPATESAVAAARCRSPFANANANAGRVCITSQWPAQSARRTNPGAAQGDPHDFNAGNEGISGRDHHSACTLQRDHDRMIRDQFALRRRWTLNGSEIHIENSAERFVIVRRGLDRRERLQGGDIQDDVPAEIED